MGLIKAALGAAGGTLADPVSYTHLHDINIIAKKQEIMYSSFVKNEYYFS